MFGIGETEFVIILVFAFLLFGPDKLPGIGRTIGRALRQFRDASNGFTEVVQSNIMDPAAEELKKSPKQRHAEEAARNAASGAPSGDVATDEEGAEAAHHETFAERKARLQAERAAAAAKGAVQESEDQSVYMDDEDADSDADIAPEDVAEAGSPDSASAQAESAAKAEPVDTNVPKPTSAADLYALSERHSSRRRAQEAEQESTDDSADSDADVSSAQDEPVSGEEDGSTQA